MTTTDRPADAALNDYTGTASKDRSPSSRSTTTAPGRLGPLSEALVNDWAEYEFAGMDDPAPVIRARLSAIEAAVRADATRAAEAEHADVVTEPCQVTMLCPYPRAHPIHDEDGDHDYAIQPALRADATRAADAEVAGLRVSGRDIHRLWRDGMLAQGRDVAPERMAWDTLDQRDRDLDDGIAAALAAQPAPDAEVAALRAALEYVTHRSDCGHGHKDVIHIAPAHFTGPACPHCSDAEYADLMEREDPCLICAALAAQPAAPEPTTTAVPLDVPTREATPAAPEAEPVVILHGDEHDDPGGYCATCEALAKSAPEAEPVCVSCGDTEDNALHRSQTHPSAHPFTPATR